MDIVTLSIPAFLLLMGLEWLGGRRRGRKVFRGPDVFADLALGSAQTIFGVVAAGLLLGGYLRLYDHRLLAISPSSPLAWVTLLLGVDFLYYWFHRASHRMNLGWAAHAPHHQSEDYNLAVALRQGPVQPLLSHVFYLPLAVIGFPPEMFAAAVGINTVYQFWIHTELIGKLGPLEWVLNTPSHHRVHHGCNGRYLDKNHAGMLILWDRMFGTFEPEREAPTYGTVEPVGTWNPMVAAWAPFGHLLGLAWRAPRYSDKLRLWLMPPEWRPRGLEEARAEVAPGRPKYSVRPPRRVGGYVTLAAIVTLGVTVVFLLRGPSLSGFTQAGFVAWFAASAGALGGLLEGRRWAAPLEVARVVAAPLVMVAIV